MFSALLLACPLVWTCPDPVDHTSTAPYEQELDELALELVPALQVFIANPGSAEVDGDAWRALSLVAEWPHPYFRSTLEALLEDGRAEVESAAARAIANYCDDHAFASLEPLVHCRAERRFGCSVWSVGAEVEQHLANFGRAECEALPGDASIPIGPRLRWVGPELLPFDEAWMTVPRAAEGLQSEHLSTRLRAVAWLADRGIVLDVAPLRQAWRLLNTQDRLAIFELGKAERIGQDRLRAVLEAFAAEVAAEQAPDTSLAIISRGLADAGSRMALDFARPIIERMLDAPTPLGAFAAFPEYSQEEAGDFRPLEYALRAVQRVARDSDLELALSWANSKNLVVANGAGGILAAMDDPVAIEAGLAALEVEVASPAWMFGPPGPLGALEDRAWPVDSTKVTYARALTGYVSAIVAESNAGEYGRTLTLYKLGMTLRVISDRNMGWFFGRHLSYEPAEATKAAEKWAAWAADLAEARQ